MKIPKISNVIPLTHANGKQVADDLTACGRGNPQDLCWDLNCIECSGSPKQPLKVINHGCSNSPDNLLDKQPFCSNHFSQGEPE